MKNALPYILGVVASSALASPALASQLIAMPGETLALTINSTVGTILQLPVAVKTITPSRHYVISQLGAAPDQTTGAPSNVKTVQIRAAPGAGHEDITIVLASGKPLRLQLKPSADADKYQEIALPSEGPKTRDPRFLASELGFLRNMILDQGAGIARQVVDKEIEIPGVEGIKGRLVRVYASQGLTGYAIILANHSEDTVILNPASLWIGKPNRAAASQADKYVLPSCENSDVASCSTVFRMVVRGNASQTPDLVQRSSSKFPFIKTHAEKNGDAS